LLQRRLATTNFKGGSVSEWLASWTQIAAATLSGNSLRQTVHTHRASVQAAKLVAALLRAWRKVMAAYRRVYDLYNLQAYCQEPGSAAEPYAQQSSVGYLYLFLILRTSFIFLLRTPTAADSLMH